MNVEKRDILFVAADSGECQFRNMVDPELEKRLGQHAIRCHKCLISELSKTHLQAVDTVVLMRSPLIGHCKNDYLTFRDKSSWLYEWTKRGGNLVLMFAESYGRTERTLNEFAEEFDIAFVFNYLEESAPARRGMMPLLDFGRLLRVKVNPFLPGLAEIKELDLIVEGGHGTQHLTCLPGREWQILLQGSSTCTSRPFPEGLYGGGGDQRTITAPVLGAYRTYGKGTVTAFPASSPFWIANAFLPRWKGTLMMQHQQAGLSFLVALLQRENPAKDADEQANKRLVELDAVCGGRANFNFCTVSPKERQRLRDQQAMRIWIGCVPAGQTVSAVVADAVSCGCVAAVIVHDWRALTAQKWQTLREEYRQYQGIEVLPGYEQLDEEGNCSVVFNVAQLPEQRLRYPGSNLLEDLLAKLNGYSAVYARLGSNRLPYWRHGGYNLFEIAETGDLQFFRERAGSGGFIGGVHICRGEMPSQECWQTWVMADSPIAWKTAVTENIHFSYVTEGPRVRAFELSGINLILDDWEGYWYEWENGQQATLEIAVEADANLAEVCVWDGEEMLHVFSATGREFNAKLALRLDHDLHLHLTARDVNGLALLCSWPIHTRNRLYWAHCGADQMNDYHNVYQPDPKGFLGIGEEYYEPYGFVTLGYAWGDYIRITPPKGWSELYPSGIEVSSMAGNFKSFHPSPFLRLPEGFDFLNDHERKLGRCTQKEHLVASTAQGAWLERTGAMWTGHGGKQFTPTRTAEKSDLWRADALYRIPAWNAGGPCIVEVEITLTFLRAFRFQPAEGFSLAHSQHEFNTALRLRCADQTRTLADFLHPGHPDSFTSEKEWDTTGIIPLLLLDEPEQPRLPVPLASPLEMAGDPVTVFRFELRECPGALMARGWMWKRGLSVLSYDLVPHQKEFQAGDTLVVRYEFSCADR